MDTARTATARRKRPSPTRGTRRPLTLGFLSDDNLDIDSFKFLNHTRLQDRTFKQTLSERMEVIDGPLLLEKADLLLLKERPFSLKKTPISLGNTSNSLGNTSNSLQEIPMLFGTTKVPGDASLLSPQQELEKLKKKFEQLQATTHYYREEMAEMEKKCSAAHSKMQNWEKNQGKVVEDLNDAEVKLQEKEELITTLQARVSTLEDEVLDMLEESESREESLNAKIEDYEQEIEELQQKVTNLENIEVLCDCDDRFLQLPQDVEQLPMETLYIAVQKQVQWKSRADAQVQIQLQEMANLRLHKCIANTRAQESKDALVEAKREIAALRRAARHAQGGPECVFCFEPADLAVTPCGHMVACTVCFNEGDAVTCPVCRGPGYYGVKLHY